MKKNKAGPGGLIGEGRLTFLASEGLSEEVTLSRALNDVRMSHLGKGHCRERKWHQPRKKALFGSRCDMLKK